MCDQDHFEEDIKKYSRRDLATWAAAGVGASFLLPRAANAAEVEGNDVVIETEAGKCDAYFVTPTEGKHAAVLIWPDIFGLRPAFRQMGKRLAESGYSVLVVNPFYRKMKAPTASKGANTRIQEVIPLYRSLKFRSRMPNHLWTGWTSRNKSTPARRSERPDIAWVAQL